MTDKEIFSKWGASYYVVEEPRKPIPNDLKARARAEFDANPVACLLENVTEAQGCLRDTTERFFDATRDGLFDAERFGAVHRDDREEWLSCADTVRGDYHRARSDLDHWRGMVANYRAGTAPKSLRALADAKAAHYEPDTDADTNAQRLAATTALAHWSERQPGEDDE